MVAAALSVALAGCHSKSTGFQSGDSFDFIVVGSGAGGGPLAARLARAGKRVLLLEAGEDVGGTLKYEVPAMHALSTEDPRLAWWFFVQHHADAAVDRLDSKWTEQGILYPRGSALGGSSAVNAMVTVLPSPSDWDRLASLLGDPSFRAVSMDRYVDRVREWLDVQIPSPSLALGDRRVASYLTAGAAAYAHTTLGSTLDPASLAQTESDLDALLGADVNEDLRGGETTGIYRLPLATAAGRRNGTRERILDTVARGFPLTVVTGAFVTRVLWDDTAPVPTARGVEYVHASSVYGANLAGVAAPPGRARALAASEVVVSAGAFNSPQLLMLSGVGDPALLRQAGIKVVVASNGVGNNLQDRYEAPVVTEFSQPLDIVARCHLGQAEANDPCLREWRMGGGVYQTSGFLAGLLTRSSPSVPLADLVLFAVPTDAHGYYPGYAADSAAAKNRFTWLLLKAHTQNRDGYVHLASANPFDRPLIDFRSYDENDPLHDPDLLALVSGVKLVRTIEAQMQTLVKDNPVTEILPGPAKQTDEDLAAWIYHESWGHHACCTDRMGRTDDPTAVVDSAFRVIGASRLRVVDASVFDEIPGTFIAFPTYMLAEKAADTLLAEYP